MRLPEKQQKWLEEARASWNNHFSPSQMAEDLYRLIPPVPEETVVGAIIHSSREKALSSLDKDLRFAEIGTLSGYLTDFICRECRPQSIHLYDLTFDQMKAERPWLVSDTRVTCFEGDSSTLLEQVPDGSYDVIYIDGDHGYDGVKSDIEVSKRKLAAEGLLIFNDYTLWSPLEFSLYGVVSAVNELLASRDWHVEYMALHPLMYCDLGIRRVQSSR